MNVCCWTQVVVNECSPLSSELVIDPRRARPVGIKDWLVNTPLFTLQLRPLRARLVGE